MNHHVMSGREFFNLVWNTTLSVCLYRLRWLSMITIFRVGPAPSRLLLGLLALNYSPCLAALLTNRKSFWPILHVLQRIPSDFVMFTLLITSDLSLLALPELFLCIDYVGKFYFVRLNSTSLIQIFSGIFKN